MAGLFPLAFLTLWLAASSYAVGLPEAAQENGNLQLHFINVGQGDGALLVSPGGETVLFDNGVRGNCDRIVRYLSDLGVTRIDYHIASHYHADHIGCTKSVLALAPLDGYAFDRGGSYNSATFSEYLRSIGGNRRTARLGEKFTLDAGDVVIEFVAVGDAGLPTRNENDKSLVAVVRYGAFDAVIGGDLSGYDGGGYRDIETLVATNTGQVELYKVHHHGSRYSTNEQWLSLTTPIIGIISVGDGNSYSHPAPEALNRLHDAGVRTYWTGQGAGYTPNASMDRVGDNIVVQVARDARYFTVSYSLPRGRTTDTYMMWEYGGSTEPRR